MEHELLVNIIGYAGAVVGAPLMLPQVLKSWKTKKVDDVSGFMIFAYVLNCTLWLAYNYLINATPAVITNAIALVISIILLILKIKYSKKE